MKHYSEIELENFLERRMFWLKRYFCAKHLKKCPSCRILLEECRQNREFLKELTQGVNVIEENEVFIRQSQLQSNNRDIQ